MFRGIMGKILKFTNVIVGVILVISFLVIIVITIRRYYKRYNEIKDQNFRADTINAFKELRAGLIKRFIDASSIPIVVQYPYVKPYDAVGRDNVTFENNYIYWMINDKMAVIQIKQDLYSSMLLLQDCMDGFGFQAMIFNVKASEWQEHHKTNTLNIISDYNAVIKVTGIKASCYLTITLDNVNIGSSVGIELNSNNFELNNVDNLLIDKFVNTSILSLFDIPSVSMLQLLETKGGVKYFANTCIDNNMDLRGIFINSVYDNKLCMMNELLTQYCYKSCSNVKLTFRYYSLFSKLINNIKWTIWILASIVTPLLFATNMYEYSDNANVGNIVASMARKEDVPLDKFADVTRYCYVPKFYKFLLVTLLKRNDLFFHTENLIQEYARKNILQIIASNIVERYTDNPFNTKIFRDIQEDVAGILNVCAGLKNEESSYFRKFDEKIMSLYRDFFKNLEQHEFLVNLFELQQQLNVLEINAHASYEDLMKIKVTIDNIRRYYSSKPWWTDDAVISRFESYISMLDKYPLLYNRVIEEYRSKLSDIRFFLIEIRHSLIDNFMKNGTLSENFNNFSALVSNILSDPLFYKKYEIDHDLIIPARDQFCLWDLDQLDQIIENVNNSDEFRKLLDSVPFNSKKVFEKMIRNQIKSAIQYGFVNSQSTVSVGAINVNKKITIMTDLLKRVQKLKTYDLNIPNLTDVMQESLNTIYYDITQKINDSLFGSHKLLNKWNNAVSLDYLIFESKQWTDLFDRNLKEINKSMMLLEGLLPIWEKHNIEQYYVLLNIQKELKNYQDGHQSSIANFQDLFNQMSKWTIKYRDEKKLQIKNPSNLFEVHFVNYENALLAQNNTLALACQIEQFKQVVEFFNSKVFNNSSVDNLHEFCKMLDRCKEDIRINKIFLSDAAIKNQFERLCRFRDMFIQEDNKLKMKIRMLCHVNHDNILTSHKVKINNMEEMPSDRIKNYRFSSLSGVSQTEDDISAIISENDSWSFSIEIANSVNLEILKEYRNDGRKGYQTNIEKQVIKFSGIGFLSFLEFARDRLILDQYIQIVADIKSGDGAVRYMQTYIHLLNFQDWFRIML